MYAGVGVHMGVKIFECMDNVQQRECFLILLLCSICMLISYFCSKDAADIVGLGSGIIRSLYQVHLCLPL